MDGGDGGNFGSSRSGPPLASSRDASCLWLQRGASALPRSPQTPGQAPSVLQTRRGLVGRPPPIPQHQATTHLDAIARSLAPALLLRSTPMTCHDTTGRDRTRLHPFTAAPPTDRPSTATDLDLPRQGTGASPRRVQVPDRAETSDPTRVKPRPISRSPVLPVHQPRRRDTRPALHSTFITPSAEISIAPSHRRPTPLADDACRQLIVVTSQRSRGRHPSIHLAIVTRGGLHARAAYLGRAHAHDSASSWHGRFLLPSAPFRAGLAACVFSVLETKVPQDEMPCCTNH